MTPSVKVGTVRNAQSLKDLADVSQQQKNMDQVAGSLCCLMTTTTYVHTSTLEKPEHMFGWKPWMVELGDSMWAKALLPTNQRTMAVVIGGEKNLVKRLNVTWEQWLYFLAGTTLKQQDVKDRIKSWVSMYPMTMDQFRRADLKTVSDQIRQTWDKKPPSPQAEMAFRLSGNPSFRIKLSA